MSHTQRLARARRKADAGECTLPGKPHSHIFRGARMVCVPYVLKLGSLERVIAVVDEARLTPVQRKQLAEHRRAEAEYRRDYDSERWLRMAEMGV